MIRVTVEVLPFGDVATPEHIQTMLIANVGPRHRQTGGTHADYAIYLAPRGARPTKLGTRGRRCRILNHDRSEDIIALVAKAFTAVVGGKK